MGKKISVLVPVYQNAGSLRELYARILKISEATREHLQYELICVNDGSTDGSAQVLRELFEENKNSKQLPIRVLDLSRNFGQISALFAGLACVDADACVMLSADLQDPPEEIPRLVEGWERGHDLVYLYREDRDESRMQVFISNLFWTLLSKYAVPGYPKTGFDFCLIDRQILKALGSFSERNTHIFPLIFWLGFRRLGIPYKREARAAGRSQWGFWKKIKLFVDCFVAFSYLPIRMISAAGFVVSVLVGIYLATQIIAYLRFGNPYSGWTTVICLVGGLGGLILITLGIIGEYLWRVLDQVRQRPVWVVRSDSARETIS